jgi:hypothetical protein
MSTPKTPNKLTRAQLANALDSVPVSHILGKAVSRELTPKQRAFAVEVAKGSTGAEAYRKAYKTKGKTLTQANEASRLKARPDIAAEVEAIQAAIRAQEYQTPAALRSLVIHSLVKVISDPDSKPGQITAAAKVLGTVTEVAAFTERKEVRTITSSETARAQVLEQLRTLVQGSATDATIIDREADSLLAELSGGENVEGDTHPEATPQTVSEESLVPMHTIPHERSPHPLSSAATPTYDPSSDDAIFMEPDPTPSTQDDPPSLV